MSPDIISNLTSGAIYDNTMDFWNSITAPPLLSVLTPYDVATIDDICRDPKLKTKLDAKYEYFNQILEPRGFTKLTQGTNRAVYRFREDERFVIKIATSQAGLQDSPAEFRNQQLYLPDVAKCFEVTPSGTIGLFERVTPIRSKEQLLSIVDDVYLFYYKLFRKHAGYVMADIGIEFYKNLGIRDNFGIVLLDYPLLYKIDKNKLYCDRIDRFGTVCGGQIDYDDGYNFLKCTRCGKQYLMKKLAIESGTIEEFFIKNFVKRKEVSDMKVLIKRGDEVVAESRDSVVNSGFINPAVSMRQQAPNMVGRNNGPLKVCVTRRPEETVVEEDRPEEYATSDEVINRKSDICISLNGNTKIQEDEEMKTVLTVDVNRKKDLTCDNNEDDFCDNTELSKAEVQYRIETDTVDENPYLSMIIDKLIDEFEGEANAQGIDVDWVKVFMDCDCNYQNARYFLIGRIGSEKCRQIARDEYAGITNDDEDYIEGEDDAEDLDNESADNEVEAEPEDAVEATQESVDETSEGDESEPAEDVEETVEGDTEEVEDQEPVKEKTPIQSAPYPPIEKRTNVTMNMESETDSDYLGEGSNSKYPAKGKGKKKGSRDFANY